MPCMNFDWVLFNKRIAIKMIPEKLGKFEHGLDFRTI